jgi:hypothetical protein
MAEVSMSLFAPLAATMVADWLISLLALRFFSSTTDLTGRS